MLAVIAAAAASCHAAAPESPSLVRSRGVLESGRWDGVWRFRNGVELGELRTTPQLLRRGDTIHVGARARGVPGSCRLQFGVLPPRVQARQHVYALLPPSPPSETEGSRVRDARSNWAQIRIETDGQIRAEVVLGEAWHARAAVLVAELRCGTDSARIPVVAGARAEWGSGTLGAHAEVGPAPAGRVEGARALLALLPVSPGPTRVVASRIDAPSASGPLAPWRVGDGHALVGSVDGEPAEGPATSVWFAWSDRGLYWAGQVPDPDMWSDYENHDDPLYKQEVMELFLAADNSETRYLEYELSARNVTFDASFARYRRGDEAWDSAWRTRVDVRGTINDASDQDEGWSFEAMIPWSELCEHTDVACPVGPGTQLWANVFRLENPGRKRRVGLALTPTFAPDFHDWNHAAVLELGL